MAFQGTQQGILDVGQHFGQQVLRHPQRIAVAKHGQVIQTDRPGDGRDPLGSGTNDHIPNLPSLARRRLGQCGRAVGAPAIAVSAVFGPVSELPFRVVGKPFFSATISR